MRRCASWPVSYTHLLPSEFDYNNPVATDGEKLYTVCNRIEAEENGRIRTFTNLISLSLQDGALQTLREWDCDAYLWGAEGSTLSVMLPVDTKEASVSFNIELISPSGELLATQPFQNIAPRYYVTENTIYWYSLEDGSIYARRLDSSEEPVSYTHLDVYKRQPYICLLPGFLPSRPMKEISGIFFKWI